MSVYIARHYQSNLRLPICFASGLLPRQYQRSAAESKANGSKNSQTVLRAEADKPYACIVIFRINVCAKRVKFGPLPLLGPRTEHGTIYGDRMMKRCEASGDIHRESFQKVSLARLYRARDQQSARGR